MVKYSTLFTACVSMSCCTVFASECIEFQSVQTINGIIAQQESHAVADLNQDNVDDFVFQNIVVSNHVNGYKSLGTLPFYASELSQYAVATGDINGDGHKDIIRSIYNGNGGKNIEVLINKGDGAFAHPSDLSNGKYSNGSPGIIYDKSLVLADVNGDKNLDIISNTRTQISVLMGNGDGTFQRALLTGVAAPTTEHILVADVNKDSIPDLVTIVANLIRDGKGRSHAHSYINLLLGLGDGRFALKQKIRVDANVKTAFIGKINSKGDMGVIVTGLFGKLSGRGGIYVYSYHKDQGFTENFHSQESESQGILYATAYDFNRDGVLDIAYLRNDNILLKLNDGHGEFLKTLTIKNPIYSSLFSFRDILSGIFTNNSHQPGLAVFDGSTRTLQLFNLKPTSCY